ILAVLEGVVTGAAISVRDVEETVPAEDDGSPPSDCLIARTPETRFDGTIVSIDASILADLRELTPGDDGSPADCRLGDDQAVGNLTGVAPGAIGEAILDVVDLDGLVGRRPGQTDLDVLALDLVVELIPRDRDDVDGAFPGCRLRAVAAHRIGSQVGVIVPLEDQVHVMFVENRDPGTPQLGIVSTGMRGIDRVVE